MSSLSRQFILRSQDVIDAMTAFVRANALEMARQGKPLAVTVTEYKAKRNTEQNNYYWLRLCEISEQAWIDGRRYNRDVWHSYFKEKYAPKLDGPHGKLTPESTTKMTVKEFSEYVEKIEAEAAQEYGVRFSERAA